MKRRGFFGAFGALSVAPVAALVRSGEATAAKIERVIKTEADRPIMFVNEGMVNVDDLICPIPHNTHRIVRCWTDPSECVRIHDPLALLDDVQFVKVT